MSQHRFENKQSWFDLRYANIAWAEGKTTENLN
jgi:hypothetical protein